MLALIHWLSARIDTKTERGASTVEYGILVAVVAITLLAFVTQFFTGIGNWLQALIELLPPFS